MPDLVPGIHALLSVSVNKKDGDGRVKSGHDEERALSRNRRRPNKYRNRILNYASRLAFAGE